MTPHVLPCDVLNVIEFRSKNFIPYFLHDFFYYFQIVTNRLVASHPYLTDVTAADLQRYMPFMNVILNTQWVLGHMGLLPDTYNCVLRLRRECRECFPRHWVSDHDIHHDTCVTHVSWCMPRTLTSGFLWSWWRGTRSRHSRNMHNKQFYVSG